MSHDDVVDFCWVAYSHAPAFSCFETVREWAGSSWVGTDDGESWVLASGMANMRFRIRNNRAFLFSSVFFFCFSFLIFFFLIMELLPWGGGRATCRDVIPAMRTPLTGIQCDQGIANER